MLRIIYFYVPLVNLMYLVYLKIKNKVFDSNLFIVICTFFIDLVILRLFAASVNLKSFVQFDSIFLFLYCYVSFYIIVYFFKKKQINIKKLFVLFFVIIVIVLFINEFNFFKGIFLLLNYLYFLFKIYLIFIITFKNFSEKFVFEDDDLPQTENELLKKEKNSWEGGKVAPAHNVGTSGNIEYRGIGNRTGQQIIFDKNGNIVTTPENKGTYDYVVPKVKVASPLDTYKSLKNHNLYDVNPWIKYGNSAKDKSTKQQRKDGLRENKAGKVGNMMWGDN